MSITRMKEFIDYVIAEVEAEWVAIENAYSTELAEAYGEEYELLQDQLDAEKRQTAYIWYGRAIDRGVRTLIANKAFNRFGI